MDQLTIIAISERLDRFCELLEATVDQEVLNAVLDQFMAEDKAIKLQTAKTLLEQAGFANDVVTVTIDGLVQELRGARSNGSWSMFVW